MRLPTLATALITSNDGDVAALECCLISTHARKYRCRLQGGAHGNGIDTLLRSRHVVTQRKCLRRRLRWRFSFNSVSIFFLFSSHFFRVSHAAFKVIFWRLASPSPPSQAGSKRRTQGAWIAHTEIKIALSQATVKKPRWLMSPTAVMKNGTK